MMEKVKEFFGSDTKQETAEDILANLSSSTDPSTIKEEIDIGLQRSFHLGKQVGEMNKENEGELQNLKWLVFATMLFSLANTAVLGLQQAGYL